MDRRSGRQRLAVVTASVGAGAAAIAALVGFTRPAPVHTAPAATTTTDDGQSSQQGSSGHDQQGQLGPGSGGFVPGGGGGGGGRPDAGSNGS